MKLSFSSLAIGIVALACLLIDFSLKNWEKEERVIEYDIHSYYGYLPSLFIYDDIKLEKSEYKYGDNKYLFWPVFTEDGRKVNRMSMGTAILYTPFFLAAHIYASVTDYPEDGFSEPYKFFLLLSTIFYLIIGFDFLRKILNRYDFSDKHSAIVILLIGLGTNLLCYASQSAPMSHVYSFCLFAIFIYYGILWHQRQSIIHTAILGLSFGLISLIRPSNAVIILFFALQGISHVTGLRDRVSFFLSKWTSLLLMLFFVLLVWVPQCIYWKITTGHFIYYSYTDNGFYFNNPMILEGLFGFRKGWLIYTPMMSFALLGIFFLRDEVKKLRTAIIVFMIINIYVIFSWWCWWYGGTFGQRSFIECFPLLAIPFASWIKYLSEKKIFLNVIFYAVAAFFIWLNIFQTYQFEFHSLHHDGMTRELYFKQFGSMQKIAGFDGMVRWPNYDAAQKGLPCETPAEVGSVQIAPLSSMADIGKAEVGRKTVQFIAANGKFVCADGNLNNTVAANRDSAQGWETFTLILFEKNECAILAYNNKVLRVESGDQDAISATGERIAKWETMERVEFENNHVAFKGANGKYLSIDITSGRLYARAEAIGKNEQFEIRVK